MKNIFASLGFVLFVAVGSIAQAGPSDGGKLSTRATELTRRMSERTKLSEGQFVKVRKLNLRLLTEMADIRKQFAIDADGLDKAMADVQMRYEWDLASILWPKQLAAYEDVKLNFTAVNVQ